MTSTVNTGNLATITRTADAQAALGKQNETMGKSEFLTLFTAQLKNQNPLDPVKNEAFVSQLAQFSQLEATTTMASSLSSLIGSMQGDRMMSGSSLIGKQVAAVGIPAILSGGNPVTSMIDLPNGADSVKIEFFDPSGAPVRADTLGSQAKGQTSFIWDGTDDNGIALPDGNYSIVATATLAGQSSVIPVSTLAQVWSVSAPAGSQDLSLEVGQGISVPLSSVTRVGG